MASIVILATIVKLSLNVCHGYHSNRGSYWCNWRISWCVGVCWDYLVATVVSGRGKPSIVIWNVTWGSSGEVENAIFGKGYSSQDIQAGTCEHWGVILFERLNEGG
jgi:hypothetical protein